MDLASLSDDDLKALYYGQQDKTTTAPQAAAIGAHQGATFGFSDELAGLGAASGLPVGTPPLISAPVGAVRRWLGSDGAEDAYQAERNRFRSVESKASEEHPVASAAGQVGANLAMAGGLGGMGLSLGTNAARAGMGLGRTAIGSAMDGAALGGLQGAGNAEEGKRLEGATNGIVLGGGIGAAAPFAIAGASTAARRLVSPFTISPERRLAAAILGQEGVPITAGQASGSKGLRFAESELGGGRIAEIADRQGEAFTDAAMRRAGGSGLATPDNLATLNTRLGQGFEDIAARNTMTADQQMGQDIGTALNRYGRLLEAQQRPIIDNVVDDLVTRLRAGNGTLPGTEYQAIRSDLSLAAKSTNNQALAGAFRGVRNALDNAMERSINPADAGQWGELRRQYGNMKVLERAALGGGEEAGLGMISPARLRMAASTGNRGAFARGDSDFTELAKAGQAVMTPLPNSGTAARTAVRHLSTALVPSVAGAGAGGAYGAKEGGLSGAIAGAITGAAVPFAAGRTLLSRPVQRYLSNQALAGQMSPEARSLAALILTNGALGRRNHP
jgi:hypothetical protein